MSRYRDYIAQSIEAGRSREAIEEWIALRVDDVDRPAALADLADLLDSTSPTRPLTEYQRSKIARLPDAAAYLRREQRPVTVAGLAGVVGVDRGTLGGWQAAGLWSLADLGVRGKNPQ